MWTGYYVFVTKVLLRFFKNVIFFREFTNNNINSYYLLIFCAIITSREKTPRFLCSMFKKWGVAYAIATKFFVERHPRNSKQYLPMDIK